MHGDSMEQELINQLLALPGETIHLEKGEFLFHEGDIADHFFICLGDVYKRQVYSIRYDVLEPAIAKDHSLAIAMMKIYTLHMRRQQAKYRDLLLYGKKGAFYSTLLRLANSYGIQRDDGIYIDIALTNQELAEFAATSRESLNRMLSELRKLGYVAYDKHHLVICDLDALIGLLDLDSDTIDPNISNIE